MSGTPDPWALSGAPRKRARVLLVDDDPIAALVISACLPHCTVVKRGGVDEAWHELSTGEPFDLVLCDVILGEGDSGFRLVSLLELSPLRGSVPVVMMSASPGLSVEHGLSSCVDFLTKPISKDLLRKKVDLVIDNSAKVRREAEYEKELGMLQERIHTMEAKTEQILETPLQAIIVRLKSLLSSSDSLGGPLAKELGGILRTLASTKLYEPALERVVHAPDLDPLAKSFILDAFGRPQIPYPEVSSVTPAPSRLVTSPTSMCECPVCERLREWDFEALALTLDELEHIAAVMLCSVGVPEAGARALSSIARERYRARNPYHNFAHGVDCMQAVFSMLLSLGGAALLTQTDVLSLVVAGLMHDIGHPGTTNAYQVGAETEFALTYNDRAVLESYHASTSWRILRFALPHGCGVLDAISAASLPAFKRDFLEEILATDMGQHMSLVAQWKTAVSQPGGWRPSKEDPEARSLLRRLIIKCADVSNVARPWRAAHAWAHRVCREFFAEGRLCREKGMPVLPFMDEAVASVPRVNTAFIDVSAATLFSLLSAVVPGTHGLVENVAINRQKFQDCIDRGLSCCSNGTVSELRR
eukprot:m51a1_g5989 3',5'-cyclic-AMP phosphodiesterase, putative (588) ;mRNA; f:274922-276936